MLHAVACSSLGGGDIDFGECRMPPGPAAGWLGSWAWPRPVQRQVRAEKTPACDLAHPPCAIDTSRQPFIVARPRTLPPPPPRAAFAVSELPKPDGLMDDRRLSGQRAGSRRTAAVEHLIRLFVPPNGVRLWA